MTEVEVTGDEERNSGGGVVEEGGEDFANRAISFVRRGGEGGVVDTDDAY